MSFEQRRQKLIDDFAKIPHWEDRYRKIIEMGKHLDSLPDKLKTEEAKIKGCQSQVWMHAKLTKEGLVVFQGDSDALIVRGLVAVLIAVYSRSTPDEILQNPPEFLETLGFGGNLSPNRANGLYSMVKQIQRFATAYKYLQSQRSE